MIKKELRRFGEKNEKIFCAFFYLLACAVFFCTHQFEGKGMKRIL